MAYTRARVPLTFGHVHSPPLLPNLLKKGGSRLNSSKLRHLVICLEFNGKKKPEDPRQNPETPRGTPPLPGCTHIYIYTN